MALPHTLTAWIHSVAMLYATPDCSMKVLYTCIIIIIIIIDMNNNINDYYYHN